MSKVSKHNYKNWVLYIEQQNAKNQTQHDVLLDKVFDTAKSLGSLYKVDSVDVYSSDKNVHVGYVFNKRHLFINMIPIDEIKDMTEKQCAILLRKLIDGLNLAKSKLAET